MQFECSNCGHRWYPRYKRYPSSPSKCPKCKREAPFHEVGLFSNKSFKADGFHSGSNDIGLILGIFLIIFCIPGIIVLKVINYQSESDFKLILYLCLIGISFYGLVFVIFWLINHFNPQNHAFNILNSKITISNEDLFIKDTKNKIRTSVSNQLNKPFLQTRKNTKIPNELLGPILKDVEKEFTISITSSNKIVFVSDIYKVVFKQLNIKYDR